MTNITAKELASKIDHTVLKPEATIIDIEKLCEEAISHSFASCCVNPYHVELVAQKLKRSPVKTCTVIGFPLGANDSAIKYLEAKKALDRGASELDMVINIGALINGDENLVAAEISELANIAHKGSAILKVIVETCLLNEAQKIKIVGICEKSGADFIKTSTGFSKGGATIEDIKLFKSHIKGDMKIKASGGIRDLEFALQLIDAEADRIGASAGISIMEEFAKRNK
jgi:deoxyribose-phosphate aldolase